MENLIIVNLIFLKATGGKSMKNIDLDYLGNKESTNIFIQLDDIDDLYVEIEGVPEGKLSSSRLEYQEVDLEYNAEKNKLVLKDGSNRDYREKVIVKFYLTQELAKKLSFNICSHNLKINNIILKSMSVEEYRKLECKDVKFIEEATFKSSDYLSAPVKTKIINSSNISLEGPIKEGLIIYSNIKTMAGVFGAIYIGNSKIAELVNSDTNYRPLAVLGENLHWLEDSFYKHMTVLNTEIDSVFSYRNACLYNIEFFLSTIYNLSLSNTRLTIISSTINGNIISDSDIHLNDCRYGERIKIETKKDIILSDAYNGHKIKIKKYG